MLPCWFMSYDQPYVSDSWMIIDAHCRSTMGLILNTIMQIRALHRSNFGAFACLFQPVLSPGLNILSHFKLRPCLNPPLLARTQWPRPYPANSTLQPDPGPNHVVLILCYEILSRRIQFFHFWLTIVWAGLTEFALSSTSLNWAQISKLEPAWKLLYHQPEGWAKGRLSGKPGPAHCCNADYQ